MSQFRGISINPAAKSHPVWDLVVGAFFVGGQIVATSYTVMTDENLFGVHVPFSWDILMQPVNLLHGMYADVTLWSVSYSWFLVSCYALLSLIDHFRHHKAIHTTVWCLIGLDSFANAQYFSQYPWAIMLISTLLLFFFLSYGGKIGMTLIANAVRNVRREPANEEN
jgi:hypothetical protein